MTEFTAIYTRVSTDEQAQSGISLAMQRDLCERYVALHDLPGDVVMFTDEGKSAASLDRPALDKLRSFLTEPSVTNLVVFKLDRLTRKVGDLCVLLGECERHGVNLHGVRDKLDTGTASGRLVLHIMGAVAEWERDTIADRTRSGLAHIRRQGYHIGAPPYGWDAVSHDGPGQILMPNGDYPNIQRARTDHDTGKSYAAIGLEYRGQHHPQAGKRIVTAPLMGEMIPLMNAEGKTIGYKRPVE